MNEKIDTCYICQGPPTGAVGAQVQGDTATGDYCVRIAAVLTCDGHVAEASRRLVQDSWTDLAGDLCAQVHAGLAIPGREEWIIERALRLPGGEQFSRADFEEACRQARAEVMSVEVTWDD